MIDLPTMTLHEFKAQLQANGFSPNTESLEEMYEALPHLNKLRARLRRPYVYSDEPAHVFAVSPVIK